MSAAGAPKVNLDKPMDRYTARRLADAIKSIAGYRVERTYTAPAGAGAYVIDVTDTITKLKYLVTGPASWLDVRGETASARRQMASRNMFPTQSTAGDAAETPDPEPPTREEPKTMTQSPPAAPATRGGGFNFEQWTSITRTAIETAEVHIERLQEERGRLDEQVREAERRVKTRRQEIDGQVAELRSTMKKLQRAIDDVDRPVRTPASAVPRAPREDGAARFAPRSGPNMPKWAPIALEYAKKHGGEIHLGLLAAEHQVPKGRFSEALKRLVEGGQLEVISSNVYRVVAP